LTDTYTPGQWFHAETVDELQAFYLARLPAIRQAAHAHGYAIGLHGSTRRDLDLIAAPWRDGASDADTLAHAVAQAACGITRAVAYYWERKPAGRLATSIPICWTAWHDQPGAGHIDLSVVPRSAIAQKHGATCQADSSARDVCEGMYAEKCDDVIGLCEALRAVLALAGESAEVRKIVADAIAEHGGAAA